jgi:UDP-N-acetylglucosamine--dolichyl-phosphate N-acetylglucosaminephosphotransferase
MGFADDVLDIRWRHKIPLPLLANLPLILVYQASGGLTGVSVPTMLRPFLGGLEAIELGAFF